MKRLLPLAGALVFLGCPSDVTPPGDESMGTYTFTATPVSIACGLVDVPKDPFQFQATFSRFRDGGGTFLTLNGVTRDAGFDGQVIISAGTAPRTFTLPDGGSCAPCTTAVTETLSVALLSKSQNNAANGVCPPSPLDGGVPQPDDAGLVTRPGETTTGFDAVRACGELRDVVVATPPAGSTCDPLCLGCNFLYSVSGDRK